MDEILRFKCEECGKEIKSLYPKQLEHLIKQHNLTHEEKNHLETDLK